VELIRVSFGWSPVSNAVPDTSPPPAGTPPPVAAPEATDQPSLAEQAEAARSAEPEIVTVGDEDEDVPEAERPRDEI
jgi:hypothetical protein